MVNTTLCFIFHVCVVKFRVGSKKLHQYVFCGVKGTKIIPTKFSNASYSRELANFVTSLLSSINVAFMIIISNDSRDSRYHRVGAGSLRIDSLESEDAGLYTCRATNMEDSIDAEATLSVLGSF